MDSHWIDSLAAQYQPSEVEGLSGREVERLIIRAQRDYLNTRAPGKYNSILRAVAWLSPPLHLEISYHVFRALDDVVDNSTPVPIDFPTIEDWLEHIKKVSHSGGSTVSKGFTLEFLLRRMLEKLGKANRGKEVAGEVVDFLDTAMEERRIRMGKKTFTVGELEAMYERTFTSFQNVTLIVFGSKTRVRDIPEFTQIPGRAFALSSLKEDLADGIFNVPEETLNQCGCDLEELSSHPDLVDENPIFHKWIVEELRFLEETIRLVKSRKMDWIAKAFVSAYIFTIERFDIAPLKARLLL